VPQIDFSSVGAIPATQPAQPPAQKKEPRRSHGVTFGYDDSPAAGKLDFSSVGAIPHEQKQPGDDLTSNPNHEGLYQIQDDHGNIHAVPFSKANEASLRDGWSFVEGEDRRYDKDAKALHPGLWSKLRDKVNEWTEPVEINPGRTGWERPPSTAEAVKSEGRFIEDVAKRTGRTLFGIADMAPQYIASLKKVMSDDPKVSEEGETEIEDMHPGAQIVLRAREFNQDWKKDPNLAVANTAGDALGMYVGGKAIEGVTRGVKAAPKVVSDAHIAAMRKIYGTSVKATERLVAETANANDKLMLEAKTEGEKAHAEKVQEVRDRNDAAIEQHAKDVETRNQQEARRVNASRKLAESKARLANHINNIHQAAVDWFGKQYDALGDLTKGVRVPFERLTEAVEEAKIQDIAGSDTKVPVFEDVLKRSRGEMKEPEAPPRGWEDASEEEKEEWTQKNLDKQGISYKDLTGYYRELGKILKSPSTPVDIREGIIRVRSTIEDLQREAARLADERAAQIAKETHSARPPSAAQLNYSIGEKYKNFAESYRDPGSAGYKAVNAENAHEATKPFLKDMSDEEVAEVKRRARGLEREGGKKTNATEWAGRNSADDTAGKQLTRAQRRAQTEKLIDQARKAKADFESIPASKPAPTLELEPEPVYEPPKEQTISPEQLRLEKRDWMNRRIAQIQSNGMKIGVRSIGTIGLAEILSHLGGLGSAGTEALAGGLAAATFFAPEILDKLLNMPGVKEKLLTVTPADEAALAKLPANQRAAVDQGIISMTQLAKMKGAIKPGDPTPAADAAKKDMAKAKEEMAKKKDEEPPDEPGGTPAPATPPETPPAAPAAAAPKVISEEEARDIRWKAYADQYRPGTPPVSREAYLKNLRINGDHVVVSVPIEDVKNFTSKGGAGKAATYSKLSTQAPPIHVELPPESEELFVRDGNHRVDAARMRGDKTIQIMIPADQYAKFAEQRGLPKVGPAPKVEEKVVEPAEPARGAQEVKLPVVTPAEPAQVAPGAPPAPTGVPLRRVDELHLDPKRFQYKLGANAQGVAGALSDAKWDQHLADPIHTWVDPEDGKEYVVNGHHRYDLAQKAGAEHIKVDPILNEEFPTAADARRFGALKNIADGNGTSIDAAKFFREEGYTPDLLAEKGISLKKSIASDGIALSHLSDDLFDRVIDGNIDPKIGAAIGDATSSAEDQEALLKVINKKTKSGVNITPDQIRESARLVKSAPSFNQTTQDLFGEHEETRNLFIEMGEVSDYIQKQLAQEKKAFGRVSSKASGEQLAKGGNVIKPEENAKIALRAAQQRELYAKRSAQAGAIHNALQEAAERLAEGGNASEIKQDAYAEIRKELEDELGETK
jgi:hypothetical protein